MKRKVRQRHRRERREANRELQEEIGSDSYMIAEGFRPATREEIVEFAPFLECSFSVGMSNASCVRI